MPPEQWSAIKRNSGAADGRLLAFFGGAAMNQIRCGYCAVVLPQIEPMLLMAA